MADDDIAIGDWSKLGAVLRDARQAKGFTQEVLAQRAGVARSWLARVEAGHRGAELERLLRLLNALDLTLTLAPRELPVPEVRLEATLQRRTASWAVAKPTEDAAPTEGG